MKKFLKNKKGITMITLSIAIIILVLISNILIYNGKDVVDSKKLENMYNDVESLRNKVIEYNVQYGALPIYNNIEYSLEGRDELKDNWISLEEKEKGKFYVIDLKALEGVTLNYGRDYEKVTKEMTTENISELEDIYIVNSISQNVFYVKGIDVKNKKYYSDREKDETVIEIHEVKGENEIRTIEDLIDLSIAVQEGNTFKGETFTLTNDLDFQDVRSYKKPYSNDYGDINEDDIEEATLKEELTNTDGRGFPSIGNWMHHFQGSFDGQNHTISNIYIHTYTNNGSPEKTVSSLFGFITDSTIKDFTIRGELITEETANIGGIASYASNVEMKNVHNYINITSHGTGYSVGGLIGSIGNDNIGLKGDNIRILNSSNHGRLEGGNHCGGLVGATNDGSHLLVESSYNEGEVTNSIITDAGILALSNGNCYINNSYNIGEISTNSKGNDSGTISLGGLVAANYGSAFVINSYNLGGVTYTGNSNANNSIAGLIGLVQGGAHILNSYNQGNIKDNTTRNYVGGLANTVDWNNDVHKQIYNSYNSGTISGGNTRYQIGYLYNGDLKDAYYKNDMGISGSNSNGTTAISDTNMKLKDKTNTDSLLYKLNNGKGRIDLENIKNDLINHGFNSNYFNLLLDDWIIDDKTNYPTLNY